MGFLYMNSEKNERRGRTQKFPVFLKKIFKTFVKVLL